jgi:DNA-binding NtrC family response regulator
MRGALYDIMGNGGSVVMKILVLSKDLVERNVIQQVVQQNRHEIVSAENSDAAMQFLQEGDIRFVIADRVTTDMG